MWFPAALVLLPVAYRLFSKYYLGRAGRLGQVSGAIEMFLGTNYCVGCESIVTTLGRRSLLHLAVDAH